MVDFGDVRTDGSALAAARGKRLGAQALAAQPRFTLELSAQRFDQPIAVQSSGGSNSTVTPVPVAGGTRWRLPLNGAREYRWTNDGFRASSLVPTGAVWKFLDTGANLGSTWRLRTFSDAGWPSGPSPLGFGETGLGTLVGSNRQITTYFRHSFLLTNSADLTALEVRLRRDDAAVAYLNGAEIFRSNMSNGPVAFNTYASNTVSGAEETWWFTNAVNPGLLVIGTNLLAVELHQVTPTSSDVIFDCELTATANQPPHVVLTSPPDGLVAAPDTLILAADATDPEDAVSRVEFFADGVKVGQVSGLPHQILWPNPPPGEHLLTARVTDAGGRSAESPPCGSASARPRSR